MAEAKVKTEYGNAGQKDKEGGEAKKKGYNLNKGQRVASKKFEGKCEELNGAIFDCSGTKQADMFVKTTKELSAYCGRTFKYGGDIRLSIETLETPTFYLPDDPLPTATGALHCTVHPLVTVYSILYYQYPILHQYTGHVQYQDIPVDQ